MTNPLLQAIDEFGAYRIAQACGVRGPSVYKWQTNKRLPRTDWTGETTYAEKIEKLSEGKYTKADLLKLPVIEPVSADPVNDGNAGTVPDST